MTDVVIRKLAPDLLGDYLQFFDREAFTDNPRWASCYCFFNHAPHDTEDWETRTAEQNRAAVTARIQAGQMHGFLAYADGRAVGWCNAGPKELYSTLDPDPPGDERVGAIVCFVIAPPYRGQGVATALLGAVCASLAEQGLTVVEAYPRQEWKNPAADHHGPRAMYEKAGFVPFREEGGALVMRRQLEKGTAA